MTKLAIGIDLHRCIGCNTCSIACKMQNNVPDGMLWNRVLTEGVEMFDDAVGVYPNLSRTYLPVACQEMQPVQGAYRSRRRAYVRALLPG